MQASSGSCVDWCYGKLDYDTMVPRPATEPCGMPVESVYGVDPLFLITTPLRTPTKIGSHPG